MSQPFERPPSQGNRNPNANQSPSLRKRLLSTYLTAAIGFAAWTGVVFGLSPDDDREALPATTEEVSDEYNARFVADYRSSLGIKFNVYAAAQNGDDSALNQAFVFNPRILEFSLTKIDSYIHDAPDNPAKLSIIKNLADIKRGASEKTIHLVLDTSAQTGCLDDDYRFIKYEASSCPRRGVAFIADDTNSISLIGTGRKVPAASGSYGPPPSKISDQHQTITHEIVHNLSSDMSNINTYKEGDNDHEITSWLMGDDDYTKDYDGKGATGYRPHLDETLETLVYLDLMPPILEAVGSD
jgi:hypothetical protein